MINYQYTETPYVDPINLEILGKTYDTLEEGHHKAVEAESKLKTEIANLDLNEAEDGFKQALLNDLNATIEANTRYGNKYSALDDVIRESGNIASNPALIGRLKAQQDYTAFMKSLDDAKIPDNYKEMYRELNPYYYQDKFDASGNVIGGSKWQAQDRPVDSVDTWKLITEGIKIAAKETGGTTTVQYLDANGEITDDMSEAVSGQFYNTTTNTWEKLTKEKIDAGIRAAIANTPGAKASIEQDYKFAVWEHDKLQNEEDGAVISELTDENGYVLGIQQYLEKKINPAVFAATYHNQMQTVSHGKGGSAYRRAAGSVKTNAKINPMNFSTTSAPITFNRNEAVRFNTNKNAAISDITNIVRKYGDENYVFNKSRGEKINDTDFADILNNPNLSASEKLAFTNQIKVYNEAITNLELMKQGMSDDDKLIFDLATRLESGEGLIGKNYNGSTEYDQKLIENLNNLANENGEIIIEFEEGDDIRNIFNGVLGKSYKEDLLAMGIKITENGFTIPQEARNQAPMLLNALMVAQDKRNLGFFTTIGEVTKPFNFSVKSVNYEAPTSTNRRTGPIQGNVNKIENIVKDVSNIYRDVMTKKDEIDKRSPYFNAQITRSVNMSQEGSYNEQLLQEMYDNGILDESAYNTRMKDANKDLERQVQNAEFAQREMYTLNYENGSISNTMTRVESSEDRHEGGRDIQSALKNGRAEFSPAMATGLEDEYGRPLAGYVVRVWDNDKDDEGNITQTKERYYYIPDLGAESGAEYVREHPKVRAASNVSVLGETRTYRDLSIGNDLENCSIKGLDTNNFEIEFNGEKITTSSYNANEFLSAIYYYENLSAVATQNGSLTQYQLNTLQTSIKTLSRIFDMSEEDVENYITNKISARINNQ